MSAHAGRRVALPAPRPHRARRPDPGLAERLLLAIGADARFTEDVLGDLAEERADRQARHGALRAEAWYLCEAARSVPHVVWSAVRHGTPRARMRLAAFCGATALAASAGAALWATRPGPPARLTVGDGPELTINNVHPVRLSARVVDAAGRLLKGAPVRYRWAGGARVPVSPDGVLQCTRAGESRVRASAGPASAELRVHCGPVTSVFIGEPRFTLGERARPLPIVARDAQSREVARLSGAVGVDDSTVATVFPDGRIQPLHAGRTKLHVTIGDETTDSWLTVFEPVKSFAGLRPDQRWVVAPLRLEPGEVIRWPLPPGRISLAFGSGVAGRERDRPTPARFGNAPSMAPPFVTYVEGPIICMPMLAPGVDAAGCVARSSAATLVIAHPGGAMREPLSGAVSLQVWEPGWPSAQARRAIARERASAKARR